MGSLFVPTRRAVVLLALAMPLSLVIAAAAPGAWVAAPILGAVLFLLVLGDALAAGPLQSAELIAPDDVEVGAPSSLQLIARFSAGRRSQVSAAFACDTRLVADGRGQLNLEPGDQPWSGAFDFSPLRRGTGKITRFWLRWQGPLGLGARQSVRNIDKEVRVWPNLGIVRSPALQTFLRDAQFGMIARRIRGEGTQFESLTDYHPGMDRRRIDWKASARHVHLYAKEYETERNNQIVFAFDCGQAMCEPIDGQPRIDRAVSAALATAYVALKSGDKAALFGFAARPEVATPFIASPTEFHRLQRAAAQLDYHAQEPNFTLAMASLTARLQRRSMIVIFSDFTDPTSAELMIESVSRLSSRHFVLFVTLADAQLQGLSDAPPDDMQSLAMAVTADSLLRQRELVKLRLRQQGANVIEAPYHLIGTRLIDAYLAVKRTGAIG